MPDTVWTQAIKEAYASAPSDEVILHTLEIHHPSFQDAGGNPAPIRLVADNQDLLAYLEADAPRNAGEQVLFVAGPFDIRLPHKDDKGVPELEVAVDNASAEIARHLETAMEDPDVIEVIYRPYLSTDLSGPQMDPPLYMEAKTVDVGVFRVTMTAGFGEVLNRKFPSEVYTVDRFPGLLGVG